MIFYKTGGFNEIIEEVEIFRETDSFVIIKLQNGRERRDAKRSNYANYFKTKKEAYDFVLEKALKNKDHFEKALSSATNRLNEIFSIDKDWD